MENHIISYNTIDKYLGYMQDAFIIEKATRFDIKGEKYIGSLAKYYFLPMAMMFWKTFA